MSRTKSQTKKQNSTDIQLACCEAWEKIHKNISCKQTLDEKLKTFTSTKICRIIESLFKTAYGNGDKMKGIIAIYSPCQGVFQDWWKIRFPVILWSKQWKDDLKLKKDTFEKLSKVIREEVINSKSLYSSSEIIELMKSNEIKVIKGWNELLGKQESPKYHTDYWKLNLVSLLTNDKSTEKDAVQYFEELHNGLSKTHRKTLIKIQNIEHKSTVSKADSLDKALRYMGRNPKEFDNKKKENFILAHLCVLLPPPVVAIPLWLNERPIGVCYIQVASCPTGNSINNIKIIKKNFLDRYAASLIDLMQRYENQKNIYQCYEDKFLQSCRCSIISNKKYKDILNSFYEYVDKGYLDGEELALRTIIDFWQNRYPNVFAAGEFLSKFQETERILYWLEKYRDHLVHSMKVYLLGRWIIEKTRKVFTQCRIVSKVANKYRKSKVTKEEIFHFAWASTAFFHDITIGMEHLEDIVHVFIESFMRESPIHMPKMIDIQNGFIEWFSKNDMHRALFFLLFNMLVDVKAARRFSREKEIHNFLNKLNSKNFHALEEFIYFLGQGDHGVISAILYLGLLFPSMYGKISGAEPNWNKDPGLHFKIAEAVLMHHLVFKTIKPLKTTHETVKFTEGNEEPVFFLPSQYRTRLTNNPFAFLLALCDHLQDWGRLRPTLEIVKKLNIVAMHGRNKNKIYISERPYGQISNIAVNRKGTNLTITVHYKWIAFKTDGDEYNKIRCCPWETDGFNQSLKAPPPCKINENNCKGTNTCKFIEEKCFNNLKKVFISRIVNNQKLNIQIKMAYHSPNKANNISIMELHQK